MPYYVKVTKKVRDILVSPEVSVVQAADGNYILYQTALAAVEGDTLSERADNVGGALLTSLQVKLEVQGKSCEKCHTPKAYGGEEPATEEKVGGEEPAAENDQQEESEVSDEQK